MSVSFLCKAFNDALCVDHLEVDNICIFHCIDFATWSFSGQIVSWAYLKEAMLAFKKLGMSNVLMGNSIAADKTFSNVSFSKLMKDLDINFSRYYHNYILYFP